MQNNYLHFISAHMASVPFSFIVLHVAKKAAATNEKEKILGVRLNYTYNNKYM